MKKPIILQEGKFSVEDLDHLKQTQKIFKTVDVYDQQLKELFRTLNPSVDRNGAEFEQFKKEQPLGDEAGIWIYYPWSGVLLHTVSGDKLFELRTNRNQQLITKDEQDKLRKAVIGITGMSVGVGMAISLAYSGISETMKISDFDELDTSNLNRLREGLGSIGKPKVDLAAEHIYEINPFSDIRIYDQGINEDNIEEFFNEPRLSVAIDEIDDFKMKVKLRLAAQKYKVPMLMFSSLGDNILIDVERYDIEPELQIFHGAFGSLTEEIISKDQITEEDEKRFAVLLVGQEFVPTRALSTVVEIGKSLVGRPQLYSTIAVDSGLATYLVRQIILGEDLKSGRYFVKFAELFNMPSNDLAVNEERQTVLKKLLG